MLIRNVSADKAINLLREWNGQVSGGRTAESEKAFRDMCDRYLLVEVESAQELARLEAIEIRGDDEAASAPERGGGPRRD